MSGRFTFSNSAGIPLPGGFTRGLSAQLKHALDSTFEGIVRDYLRMVREVSYDLYLHEERKISSYMFRTLVAQQRRDALLTVNTRNQKAIREFGSLVGGSGKTSYRSRGSGSSITTTTAEQNYTVSSSIFHLTVVDPDLISKILIQRLTPELQRTITSTALFQFNRLLPDVAIECFTESAVGLDDKAFPSGYMEDLIEILRTKKHLITAVAQKSPLYVSIDFRGFFYLLGDRDILSRGYHYGAAVASGDINRTYNKKISKFLYRENKSGRFSSHSVTNRVKLPWYETDQPLRTKSRYSRYKYWRAVAYGQKTVTYERKDKNGKSLASKSMPVVGSWKETVDARRSYWRSKNFAPQWLLLEYGQPNFAPIIPINAPSKTRPFYTGILAGSSFRWPEGERPALILPGNITGRFIYKAANLWTDLVGQGWDKAVKEVESFQGKGYYPTPLSIYPKPSGISVEPDITAPEGLTFDTIRKHAAIFKKNNENLLRIIEGI